MVDRSNSTPRDEIVISAAMILGSMKKSSQSRHILAVGAEYTRCTRWPFARARIITASSQALDKRLRESMENSRRLKAVVFDLDGLMFNTEELYQYVGSQLLKRRGKDFDDELLDQMMGRPQRVALQLMIDYHGLDATVADLARETDEVFDEILESRLECMPGLVELLAALERHNIPKAIATSSGRAFVEEVLGRFDFEPRFQFILTGDDVTHGKPHPEIYLKAAERFGLAPQEVLVLEDSSNGCRAAVAAGTFAVAVPGSHSCRHDFSGCVMSAETLADRRIYEALGIE